MAAFLDSTVKEIDNRLRELRDELSKLEAARAVLTGNGGVRRPDARPARRRARRTATRTTAATSTRPTTRRRARSRRGGRSNTRATQAVEIVRDKPGITIPELAKAMKIQPNYLYRVVPQLAADGQVKRDGKGWRLAA